MQQRMTVEYKDVCLRAGEAMPLPKFAGSLHIAPMINCDATVCVGDEKIIVKDEVISVRSADILTVQSGNLYADLRFEAELAI